MINCNNENGPPSIKLITVILKTFNSSNGDKLEIIPGEKCVVRIDEQIAMEIPNAIYRSIVTMIKTEMGMNQYVYAEDRSGSFDILLGNDIMYYHGTVSGNDKDIVITRQVKPDILDPNQMIE